MTKDEFWALTDENDYRTAVIQVESTQIRLHGVFTKCQDFLPVLLTKFTGTVESMVDGERVWMNDWDVPLDLVISVV